MIRMKGRKMIRMIGRKIIKMIGRKMNASSEKKKHSLPSKQLLPGWSPSFLRRIGEVNTIIDIGVLNGTPSLYKAFPNAHLVLVEALPQYKQICERILDARDSTGEIFSVAAGERDGSAFINHLVDAPARSSFLEHVVGGSPNSETIELPIRRLDTIFSGKTFPGPTLLKIDTEGYELNVIKGSPEFLKQVDFVIAETSVRLRHKNSYRLADLVALMRENSFEVYDILTATRESSSTPGASIFDLVFKKEHCEI
jgi:FkbM family methyltransferase